MTCEKHDYKSMVINHAKFPNNGVFIIDLKAAIIIENEMNGGRLQEDIAHTLEIKDSKAPDLAQAQAPALVTDGAALASLNSWRSPSLISPRV